MSLRAAIRARRAAPHAARTRNASSGAEAKMRLPGSLSGVPGQVQRKPVVGAAGDAYEREADQVSAAVTAGAQAPAITPLGAAPIQRDGSGGAGAQGAASAAQAVAQGGRGLSAAEVGQFGPRFGQDFSDVRVHQGPDVDRAAAGIGARAYTLGQDIAMASGAYNPGTQQGDRLMAHELTHVVQQAGGSQTIQREEGDGDDEAANASDDEPKATDYRRVELLFNGSELIVMGDGTEVMRFDGDSGRPISITEEDAEACGADADTDTYLNDPRFVGIKNKGPIPEGRYTLNPPGITEYSFGEQMELLFSGIFGSDSINIQGSSVHTGDWGEGRVFLNPIRMEQGPCGNAPGRSEFFLHGGVLRGSAGCIDIQGSFGELAEFLKGYRRSVPVKVEYDDPATRVGFWTGLGGALAYQGFGFASQLSAHIGPEFTASGTGFVSTVQYNALLDWAGGALTAGVHVDVPVHDKDAFIRAGLRGGAEYRIYQSLYGRIFGGGYYESSRGDLPSGFGAQVGGGFGYNFGPVQIEALYNFLAPIGDEPEITPQREQAHQLLTGMGFEW